MILGENMKIQLVCSRCGGTRLLKDAWASWDTIRQEWVLHSVYDNTICEDCDDDTTVNEIELPSTSFV